MSSPQETRPNTDFIQCAALQAIETTDVIAQFKADTSVGCLWITDGSSDQRSVTNNAVSVARAIGPPLHEPKEGDDIIQVIRPENQDCDSQSSRSSTTGLILHTENPGEKKEPTHVVLGCIRNDEQVATLIVNPGTALEQLSEEHITLLSQPAFSVLEAERFARNAGRTRRMIIARNLRVLEPITDQPGHFQFKFHVDFEEMAQTPSTKHREALGAFEQACRQVVEKVVLQSGHLLAIKNQLVLHGRAPFITDTSSDDRRHLIRIFV